MSAFLYFFPDAPRAIAKPADLPPECNLGPIIGDAKFGYGAVRSSGPEGTSGFMIAVRPSDEGKAAGCGYYPDDQVWAKVRGADGKVTHWIGYEKANPPGPADLQRPEMVDGYPVKLADKREWVIPCVHVPLTTLPKVFGLSPDGESILAVTSGYEDLCNESANWWDVIENGSKFNKAEWFEFACKLLAVNYRLGRWEIAQAGLLNDSQEVLRGVLYAALGVLAIRAELESQKKMADTQSDGCAAEPGDAA